jgi:hypothetical protein
MKKIFLAILPLILLFGVSGTCDADSGYSLEKALKDQNINIDHHPEHLPGAGIEPASSPSAPIEQQIVSTLSGKPFIITWYIQRISTALTGLAAAVAVLFIVQNSFMLLTSAGGSEAVTKAKKGLMWSIIGLVIIMGSYIVVKTVISLPYVGETASLLSHQFFT